MSFESIEKSRYKGRPVNLFFMKYGKSPNSYFAYTDAEKPIMTDDGVTYIPLAISRGKISVTGTMDKQAMEVRATLNIPMAEMFRVYPPASVVNITIRQGHLSDPDAQFLVAWAGRIISAKRTENELVLSCEPVATSMKRVGLRRHYQYGCPHVLYGEWCRASKSAATVTTTVSAVSNLNVMLAEGWEDPDRVLKYIGGMVEWSNNLGDVETRGILKVLDARRILLSGHLRDLKAGSTIKVILGCNRNFYTNPDGTLSAETDCHTLHNNIQNFGGCPFIPTKNPLKSLNIYY